MTDYPRRDFLRMTTRALLAASGVLGLGGLLRYLDFSTDPHPPTEFDLGPATNYPPDSRTLLADVPALLIHSDAGFTALSLTCTHLGCTVEEGRSGLICPCHGSRFDADGVVQRGPARENLHALRVEVTDDQVRLFLD